MSKEKAIQILKDLINGVAVEVTGEVLTELLKLNPPKEWIEQREIETVEGTKTYDYLPIDKVEYLLHAIFSRHKIEILSQSSGVSGAWISVRVHYLIKGETEYMFHDGTGAEPVSPKNQGYIRTAFPIAKSFAIKDACDHLGNLFGANLNRKDVVQFTPEVKATPNKEAERLIQMIEDCKKKNELIKLLHHVDEMNIAEVNEAYQLKLKSL